MVVSLGRTVARVFFCLRAVRVLCYFGANGCYGFLLFEGRRLSGSFATLGRTVARVFFCLRAGGCHSCLFLWGERLLGFSFV